MDPISRGYELLAYCKDVDTGLFLGKEALGYLVVNIGDGFNELGSLLVHQGLHLGRNRILANVLTIDNKKSSLSTNRHIPAGAGECVGSHLDQIDDPTQVAFEANGDLEGHGV